MARVLIVDDEQSVRTSLGTYAQNAGHEVSLASNAMEALDLLGKEPFDVVVTDIILPRKSGVALLADIREVQPDVPVIMITGEPEVETAAKAVREGAFDYLSKPVSREVVMRVVSAAAAKKALLDKNRLLEEENRRHRENLEQLVNERTEQLQDRNRRLASIFAASPVGICLVRDHIVLEVNDRICAMTGYSAKELLGQTTRLLYPTDEDFEFAGRENYAQIERRSWRTVETRFMRKGGTIIDILLSSAPFDTDDPAKGLTFTALDITERRQAAEDLRKSEEFSRRIIESSQDCISIVDLEGRLQFMSAGGQRLLEIDDITPLLGELWLGYWKGADRDAAVKALKKAQCGDKGAFRGYCPTMKGAPRWWDVTITPIADAEGTVDRLLAVSHDITEQERAAEAVKQSEELLRNLISSSSDGMLVIDAGGVVQFMNPAAETLLNRRAEELLGETFGIPISSDRPVELEVLSQGTRPSIVEMRAVSMAWEKGDALLASLRDVSSLKNATETVRSALEGTIQTIDKICELRDPYTAGHQRRVTNLAVSIADEIGLSVDQKNDIQMAGQLHDIGKMAIPTEILTKPGKLTAVEFSLVKSHVAVAHDILKSTQLPQTVTDAVHQHHERMDGSGYPQGLQGEEIHIGARILAVADVVEAMSSHRPYRAALGVEVALEEIKTNKGRLYDEEVSNACIRLFKEKRFSFST